MNRLIQLRNEIAEAYRQHNDDLAFELEEQYKDYAFELTQNNRIKQQYNYTNRNRPVLHIV